MTLDERERQARNTNREYGREDEYGRLLVTEQEWREIQAKDLQNYYKGSIVEVTCFNCGELFEVDNGAYTARTRNSHTGRLNCSLQCRSGNTRYQNKSIRKPRPAYWDHIKD